VSPAGSRRGPVAGRRGAEAARCGVRGGGRSNAW
jgi:hypothetical protein